MIFWILSLALTAAAVLVLLWVFIRHPGDPGGAADFDYDIEVYSDQLAELERDLERGQISADQAQTAKAEIGRRLIHADKMRQGREAGKSAAGLSARWAGMFAVLFVPIVAWATYAFVGSPDLPDQPLEARLNRPPGESSIEELVAKAERQLRVNPDDVRGWDVLAPIYARLGRFDDSVRAYRNAIRLDGSTARRQTGLGQAMVGLDGGRVGEEARQAFSAALQHAPHDPHARFYLAVGQAQDGRLAEAEKAWTELAASLQTDHPIRGLALQAARSARERVASADSPEPPGPTAQDIEAASSMSAGERTEFIRSMVERLDEKLRDNPRDSEGWKRLIRSYMVLEEPEKASAALARALEELGEGSPLSEDVKTFASQMGVEPATQ